MAVRPVALQCAPPGHVTGADAALDGQYAPAGHAVALAAPAKQNVPAGHATCVLAIDAFGQ
jgi:hypothetical protein